jgi:hypothetical protein
MCGSTPLLGMSRRRTAELFDDRRLFGIRISSTSLHLFVGMTSDRPGRHSYGSRDPLDEVLVVGTVHFKPRHEDPAFRRQGKPFCAFLIQCSYTTSAIVRPPDRGNSSPGTTAEVLAAYSGRTVGAMPERETSSATPEGDEGQCQNKNWAPPPPGSALPGLCRLSCNYDMSPDQFNLLTFLD